MSWIQQNKAPAAIIGVSVVGAAGLGFMLFQSWSGFGEKLEEFNALNGSIASLNSAQLAPTPENLAKKQALVGEFTTEAGRLQAVLAALQSEVKVEPISDTGFQAKLKTRIAETRKLAGKTMVLPAEFNLGFDRYNSELPPSNEVATELSGYLDAVEEIVKVMVASGVAQLDMIERSELPSEKGASATTRRQGQPAAAAPELVERRQVRAMVTADQSALQMLLSKLASPSEMPHFTVVRLVRIENERQEGPLRAEIGLHTLAPEEGAAPVAAPTEGGEEKKAIVTAKPAGQDAVNVLGEEKLRAYLEIDLVSFKAATAAAR
jgi:hypothetical protein